MRLFDGNIDRRPLMQRDGSGVSALVGLDGFVVADQPDCERRARGGRAPRSGVNAARHTAAVMPR